MSHAPNLALDRFLLASVRLGHARVGVILGVRSTRLPSIAPNLQAPNRHLLRVTNEHLHRA